MGNVIRKRFDSEERMKEDKDKDQVVFVMDRTEGMSLLKSQSKYGSFVILRSNGKRSSE